MGKKEIDFDAYHYSRVIFFSNNNEAFFILNKWNMIQYDNKRRYFGGKLDKVRNASLFNHFGKKLEIPSIVQ